MINARKRKGTHKREHAANMRHNGNYSFDEHYSALIQSELNRRGINNPENMAVVSALYEKSNGAIRDRIFTAELNRHLLAAAGFNELNQENKKTLTDVLNAVYFTAWNYSPAAM